MANPFLPTFPLPIPTHHTLLCSCCNTYISWYIYALQAPELNTFSERIAMATKHTGAQRGTTKLVPRMSDEEAMRLHAEIPIDEDNLVFLYEDNQLEEEVYCNTLDLHNCYIAYKLRSERNAAYYNAIIVKTSPVAPKEGHYEATQDCGICMEQMKFVNYKAKAAFNTIARQRNRRIQNTSSCGKKPRSVFGFVMECPAIPACDYINSVH